MNKQRGIPDPGKGQGINHQGSTPKGETDASRKQERSPLQRYEATSYLPQGCQHQ